jgi:hypothetical protein
VFSPVARTANGTYTQINTTFAPDLVWSQARTPSGYTPSSIDRLRGAKKVLFQSNTGTEATSTAGFDVNNFNNTGVAVESQGEQSIINYLTVSGINWFFARAPGFFDEVCYTGNGSVGGQTITHNLAVAPELIIVKQRDNNIGWRVYAASQGVSAYAVLNSTNAFATDANNPWKTPTASTFGVGDGTYWTSLNGVSGTFVAYLFATCAGVSKVGSYTGNGSSQTIACGFTAGSRFVLIKRTDSTGDWYVWDSARGIVAGNDPHLSLNTTAAEVTTDDSVDTDNSGFIVNQDAATNVNVTSATYIFLAIA